ncbi:YncE family protein [Ginsengibacter hankyongi]|uniref:YncE family protein n=2 Tax=Ginsengibacter hankyongi TaxID=2607284 RepID=A0A5J5ICL5_9BACT|nr:YncE family protein [Ginsengibacter hankyongi]
MTSITSGKFHSNITSKIKCGGNRLFAASILISLLICTGHCNAQQRTLLALSKTDHTLAMVDPVSLKVMARVPVGSDPHEVIASTDGKTAYVSIYGGGSLHEINVIDLVAKKPLYNIDTRPFLGPHGLSFVGGKLWFTVEGSKCVGRYDPATKKIDWCMGTGQDRTHMIYVTQDEKSVYTTNVSSGTVSILTDTLPAPGPMGPPGFQPRRQWKQTLVHVSTGSEGFDVWPDGKQLWTASADDGSIAVIDLDIMKVAATIDAKVMGANRLQFTPDGKMVLVSSLRNGDMCVFDVASHKDIKKINMGHGGAGILVEPNGLRAFIGCTPDNYVAVIDLKTLEVINHIDVGGGPDGLAWAVRN